MSAVATQTRRPREMPEFSAQRLFEPSRSGGPHGQSGSSLEDLILGSWGNLVTAGRAECPVCGGDLHPVGCTDCGSQLS
jgi:hypothetical protein